MIEVRVKVCGLTEVANALACVSAGADWIGLNFHPASPRSIAVDRGAEIAAALPPHAEPVGLFVDRPSDEVARVVDRVGLRTIQLHGDESPEYLRRIVLARPVLRIVRAFRLANLDSVARMLAYLGVAESLGSPPFAILVEAHVEGLPGGTGRSIARDLLEHIPDHPRLILAGGLTASNVAARVALVRPWMVDVAGGVESSPGVKDPGQVADFVAAARGNPQKGH